VGDTKGKVIFDLYSGTGTIAQILAPLAEHVTGVEIIPEAVEAARENAKLNGLSNCEFLCGDVLKVVGELQRKPDIIVLDPPREGVNPKALPKILAFQVPRIVYISCKATSLKRDLISFRLAGYRLLRLQAVDLFPGTPHVETVCLLSKLSEAKNHISVKVDMDEMDVTAAESKATYEEIQEWVQEKYGFHVSHLNIAKTKRKCGIIERQNYNLPKSEDSRSPETPPEKEKAIKEAFSYFQMI
jgi:predicted RNA methylase